MKLAVAHKHWPAAALAALCAVTLLLSIEPQIAQWLLVRLWVLILAIAPGVALVAACVGYGSWLMPRRGADLPELLVFSLACGIGVMSSLAFVAGMAGQTIGFGPLTIIAGGMILGAARLRTCLAQPAGTTALTYIDTIFSQSQPTPPRRHISHLAHRTVSLLILAAAALVAIVCLTPPIIFDVTEYHLGAWTSYARGYVPMPFNFYARFPFPIESIYFLGLGSTLSVDTAPKLFNGACVAACGVLGWLFARRLGGGSIASAIAALLALAHPVMLEVSIDAMIDAPVALLVAGSFYAGLLALGTFNENPVGKAEPDTSRHTWLLPSFLMFGTALAAKYTVAQLYLLPWALIIFSPAVKSTWRSRPALLAIACLVAAIPCLLWFGKNIAWYANPLEPFFQHIFRPGDTAAAAREKFYTESHFPQPPLSAAYWTSLLPRLHEFGWVILAACGGWIYKQDHRAAARCAITAALAFLLWNTVRASEDRFLLPMFIIAAAVAAVGADAVPHRIFRRLILACLILFATANLAKFALRIHKSEAVTYLLDFAPTTSRTRVPANAEPSPREQFLSTNLGDLGDVINQANRELPQNAKLLLVYEARPYLFRTGTVYNVVWDDSELLNIIRPAASASEALALLRRAGITHVLINRQELLRYIQQYARKAQLLRLGVRPTDDPRAAWLRTGHPEDLYPPFYRDKDWDRLRPIVHDLLDELDARATIRNGQPRQPGVNVEPVDITVTPL